MATDPWGARPTGPPPAADPRPAEPVRLPPRGRPGLIALVATITAIVLVAAFGNQAVSKEIVKAGRDTGSPTLRGLLRSALQYTWRFDSGGSILTTNRIWAGQLLALGVTFVLTFLLVLAVVRGSITFWRALFGTWMAVVVATLLGTFARSAVVDLNTGAKPRNFAQILFNSSTANAYSFVAGVGLGLVVALVTALVAVASRRSGELVVPAADDRAADRPDGRWDDRYGPEPAAPPPYAPEDSATQQFPSLRKDDRPSEAYPSEGRPQEAGTSSAWPTAAATGLGAGAGAAAVAAHERDRDGSGDLASSRRDTLDEPTQAHPVTPPGSAASEDEPTQAHPVTPPAPAASEDEPTQAHPVVPEPAAHEEPVPTNQTVQLPRFEPGQEPWNQPAPDESPASSETQQPAESPAGPEPVEGDRPTDRRADTNELPRVDPGPRFPGSEPNAPQQTHFPRPPNDEDLGHEHDDD